MIFGLLAILLTWSVGRRLAPAWPALVAAGVVALHPFQVVASNEVRMYPLLTAAGLAATLALIEAVREPGSAGRWALYGALAASVAYVSYYGFLLLAGHAVGVALVRRRLRSWRGPIVGAGTAVLCYAPWIPSLLPSITSNPVPWRPPVTFSYLLGILLTQTFGGYVLGTPAYHASGPATIWWYLLAVAFAIVLAAGLAHALQKPGIGLILFCSWLVPVSLVAAASVILNKEAAYYYHLTYLQPYAALLMVLGIVSIFRQVPAPSRNWVVMGCMVAVLSAVGLATHVAQNGSREVYRFDLAARWMERRYSQGDVTIYFAHVGQRVMRWYLRPVGPEVVISVSPHRWTLNDVRPLLRQAVAPLRVTHRRVWLVLTPPTPPGSVDELVRLLTERGYGPARQGVTYGGVSVQLFERRSR